MTDAPLSVLVEIAVDLANSLTNEDRFDRLLSAVRTAIPCDAVALLALREDVLVPLAAQGLSPDILGRRFKADEHPRFERLTQSRQPVRFAADCQLPDPYDGLLLATQGDLPVHACMGFPLYSDNRLIGLLTLDSLSAGVFDDISLKTLSILNALAAATLRSAELLNMLEYKASHAHEVALALTQEALSRDGGELIGESAAMAQLRREIRLVASSDFNVLVTGETGVGKELVARTLHMQSSRCNEPLVYVNCAAVPDALAESELFGHVRGAFTGANSDRMGKFMLADGGTLFLDEIGELSLAVQSKLLRALQSGEVQKVGRDKLEKVNVRVIAATNRDLAREVKAETFRADLYHRLSVYPIQVPPLRERDQDVLLLAGYFIAATRRKLGMEQIRLAPAVNEALLAYPWPGNVRELEHTISRAALRARSEQAGKRIVTILPEHCDLSVPPSSATMLQPDHAVSAELASSLKPVNLKEETERFQRELIHRTLAEEQGNWAAAARALSLDRANLIRLARRLGVHVERRHVIVRDKP
ncbi:nitric oxide reductase transcriptional regulator NorR [Hahella aquimaris]|uniref:nitric oxide reductase transcriptional regulator NorR n=1 Tax=Hahella sp. HNIBRBA332 TaxID=3015983 RepID=UPI00273CB598|nr:nitric oxide reductase transcriptional regulator NorR [Hahella sp. HNIBRBA332]WLQ11876.1 nitric oxide reductase transcriptional regulator NorR [Hahella sp. HNIBRBA332]